MGTRFTIVGIGEALFDVLPAGPRLGGAPLNVAVHAHQLAQAAGGRGVVVSRVGQDDLGQELISQVAQRGMMTDYLQSDPDRPTGQVFVEVDPHGSPTYDIAEHAAWDVIQYDPDLDHLAAGCSAVTFGSLAQRDAQSRSAIQRFVQGCRRATRLFDVNLRKDYYNPQVLRRSCEIANAVKLNDEELPEVCKLLRIGPASGEPDPDTLGPALRGAFGLDMVVLTRGARGTAAYTPEGKVEGEPAAFDRAPDADTVGAGDSCSAAILVGRSLRMPIKAVLDLANRVGAFVAAQPGATPPLPEEVLNAVRS